MLSVAPFEVLFRIPAEDATLAQFMPDSENIEFVSHVSRTTEILAIVHGPARFERWNVRDQLMAGSSPLPSLACGTSQLTLDGRMLACVDFLGTLTVYEVPCSEKVLEVKKFSQPLYAWIGFNRYDYPNDLGAARMQFSPDGHFLVAIPSGDQPTVTWDAWARRRIRPEGLLSLLRSGSGTLYTFLGPVRVLLSRYIKWGKNQVVTARIVSFPEGKVLSTAMLPWGPELIPCADPRFVIANHPYRPHWVSISFASAMLNKESPGAAAVELATGQMITTNTPAIDVFGTHYVAEPNPGEVGLYERGKGLQAKIVLAKKP